MIIATISDNNNIFAEGLKVILETSFECYSIQVNIVRDHNGLDVLAFYIPDGKGNVKFSSDALKIVNSSEYVSDTFQENNNYIYRDDKVNTIICKSNVVLGFLFFRVITGSVSYQKKNLNPLSVVENRVISLMSEGYSMIQIAKALNKSVKTVSFQKRSVMNKLNITNNADLYTWIYHEFNVLGR